MLVEISSEKFREKRIVFHEGLNVVLGDDVATNSIGKSSLLMVIDFVFGGESLLDHNADIVDELGDHDYMFTFQFGEENHHFKRSTDTPELIYKCGKGYKEMDSWTAEEYKAFLKHAYALEDINLTFRSIVSLYSRVWGKENIDVKQPLHSFKKQTSLDCVDNLLKLFKRFDSVQALSDQVKKLSDEKKTIGSAYRQDLIPRITKSKYKANVKLASKIEEELDDIKKNLAAYAVNINEIVNREVADLKEKKDTLLKEKAKVASRLDRVRADLSKNRYMKSRSFSGLVDFFPDVNTDRLIEVEEFHSGITKILRDELKASEKEFADSLLEINEAIGALNSEISRVLENVDNPTVIIDRVHELTVDSTTLAAEMNYFEHEESVNSELKEVKQALSQEKSRVLQLVQDVINNRTRRYVDLIYSEQRRSPVLKLSEKSYSFSAIEDTGTGKAYSNLILLDLAVMDTTVLPFVIHDSVLFKNIENEAVANLVPLYEKIGKQSFIAIDEIQKYGDVAEGKLSDSSVISLSNMNVLYTKDWRK